MVDDDAIGPVGDHQRVVPRSVPIVHDALVHERVAGGKGRVDHYRRRLHDLQMIDHDTIAPEEGLQGIGPRGILRVGDAPTCETTLRLDDGVLQYALVDGQMVDDDAIGPVGDHQRVVPRSVPIVHDALVHERVAGGKGRVDHYRRRLHDLQMIDHDAIAPEEGLQGIGPRGILRVGDALARETELRRDGGFDGVGTATDLEERRHFGGAMLVVRATAREDEYARAIHAIHPIEGGVKLIVQGEDPDFEGVQLGATGEHLAITSRHKFGSRQFRRLLQSDAIGEHTLIAPLRQLNRRQGWGLRQFSAPRQHVHIALVRQGGSRQLGGLRQPSAISEHIAVAILRQRFSRQFRHFGQLPAMGEHEGIASLFHRGGRQFGSLRQLVAVGEHDGIALVR